MINVKNIIFTYYLIGFFFTLGWISEFSRHVELNIVGVLQTLFIFPLCYPLFIGKAVAEVLLK